MTVEILELKQKRANLWEQAKALNEKVKAENRDFTAEEDQSWARLNAEMDTLTSQIERDERLLQVRASAAVTQSTTNAQTTDANRADGTQYRDAFMAWLRGGMENVEPEQRQVLRQGQHVLSGEEKRALSIINAAAGGFTVPDATMGAIVEAMLPYSGMRQSRATIDRTGSGNDWPIPTTDDTSNTGVRLAEGVQVTEQDVAFGQKILHAYVYTSKMVRVPLTFLQDSSISDVEAFLTKTLGTRLGRITNTEFTTGTGNVMPEGVATASVLGVTAAANNAITVDEMTNLEHSVNTAYRRQAEWMFADTTLLFLKKLKDGEGRPLWQPGLAVREPDMILGHPYVVNDDVAAIGAAAKSVLFGDFSYYHIRDVGGITVVRFAERYMDYLETAFMAFSRHDGALIDAGTHPIKHLVHP
jgi:HK97 family phage major capsid protein